MGLGCQINLWEIMGCDYFYVFRFNMWPLMMVISFWINLKLPISCLLLVLDIYNVNLQLITNELGIFLWVRVDLAHLICQTR